MKTTDAVAIAIQHAHEFVSPTAWGQLKHDVHVAQQTKIIRDSITGPGLVRMKAGSTHYLLTPIDALMDHATSMPKACVDLSLAVRHAYAGNDDLASNHLRLAIDAAVDSIADLNATALDNGELRLPMEFGVLGAKS